MRTWRLASLAVGVTLLLIPSSVRAESQDYVGWGLFTDCWPVNGLGNGCFDAAGYAQTVTMRITDDRSPYVGGEYDIYGQYCDWENAYCFHGVVATGFFCGYESITLPDYVLATGAQVWTSPRASAVECVLRYGTVGMATTGSISVGFSSPGY